MEPIWSKFDKELSAIYSNYLHIKTNGNIKGQWIHPVLKEGTDEIFLTLQYKENLGVIEEAGFNTVSIEREGVANGMVKFEKLPALTNIPGVIKLVYGSRKEPSLDTSVLEILARGTTPGTNAVWSITGSSTFSDHTGEGVIVGVIDTGIDYRHESFQKENSTQTRILSIWDHGLVPGSGEHSPAVALLSSPGTYGVEYTAADINTALASSSPTIRTRDCIGHGTHVAGIAAGNGKQPQSTGDPRFVFSGVAPKASLVVVKLLSPENIPTNANWVKRFKDAITYILKIGDRENMPVVINCSFGGDSGPHDGMVTDGTDGEEIFLESTFSAATGKIAVFAAGNSSMKRQHAIITIPAAGTVDVPFMFEDARTIRQDFNRCTNADNTTAQDLDFWYRSSVAGLTVQVKVPGTATFVPAAPLVLNAAAFSQTYDINKSITITHSATNVSRNGTPLERRNVNVNITPHANLHKTGVYTVRIAGPAGAEVHVWCGRGRGYGFGVDSSVTTSTPINVTDNNTVNPAGHTPSVITVAAYDDTNDHMACFSSHGPLVDYSGAGVLANKPDLAAPGFAILSAASYQTSPGVLANIMFATRGFGGGYVSKGGTSMAAPHIAGVVALMLQKKRNQTVADIKLALRNTIRTRPQTFPTTEACPPQNPLTATPVATVEEGGAGKVNANAAWNIIVP